MRKICFVLIALLVSPALADVSVTCSQEGGAGSDQFIVEYSIDDANLPRAFGLDIEVIVGTATIDTLDYSDPCFWVHPGTIVIESGSVTDEGTAVAPSDDPCALGGLTTQGVTIEMGSLYDPNDTAHQDPPASSGILLRFTVSDLPCTIEVRDNAARGGVVLEDATAAVTDLPSTCEMEIGEECFPSAHPDYAQWVTVGKPTTWCYPKQCHGDATNSSEPFGRGKYVDVGSQDVTLLLSGYNKYTTEYSDPITHPWIAADFTHSQEPFGRGKYVYVGSQDVTELLIWYNVYTTETAPTPSDCLDVP